MTVQAHPCPGDRHLPIEWLQLPECVFVDIHHVLLGGVEYELIDTCPEWPTHVAARLIPQHQDARATTKR